LALKDLKVDDWSAPEWAPQYLQYRGRPKFDSKANRDRRWEKIKESSSQAAATTPWGELADQVRAMGFQEEYLCQVRALLSSIERFRRTKVVRARRDDWPHVVGGWLMWRLAMSRADCSSTVMTWLAMVYTRLPHRLTKTEFADIVRGIGALRLFRPEGRLRGLFFEAQSLRRSAAAAAGRKGSAVVDLRAWFVAALMTHGSALRRADAIRTAAGEATVEQINLTEWVVFPWQEKTDMFGSREIEPVLVRILGSETALMKRWSRLPADASSMGELETLVKKLCADAGVRDVRALRRDAGAAVSTRADAGVLLRHRPDSSSTPRYSTTRDRVPQLRQMMAAVPKT
jgi:hypothetical protein